MNFPLFIPYPVMSSNVFTFGGLAINIHGQDVSQVDRPIKGLYGAGEHATDYVENLTGS